MIEHQNTNPQELLHSHQLKITACREGILQAMLDVREALSEHEIRTHLSVDFDRTTFYRSFKTLLEHQLIHKIVLDPQKIKYAVHTHRGSEHAHFYCEQCDSVRCVDGIHMPVVPLPEGYLIHHTDLIIRGLCHNCNTNVS